MAGERGGRAAAKARRRRSGAPVEVPDELLGRVRALCLALPEVTVRVDEPRIDARSTAYSFDIRHRSFCLLVATRGHAGRPAPLLVLRADPEERDELVAEGAPFFAPRAGPDRLGIHLPRSTDWP